MPIYEYRCTSCAHELEKLQRMSDAKLVDCPACGKPALKRLISAAAFRLKGSGWYETDFKQDNKRNLADSVSEPDGKKDTGKKPDALPAADKGDNKADSKPVAKPATASGKANAA